MVLYRTVVPGAPPTKPRQTRRDKWLQRPCVMRYRAWADSARLAALAARFPTDAPISLKIAATFKATKPQKNAWHTTVPDVDNIAKAVMDALWKKDQSIAILEIKKRWGNEPKVEIEAEWLEGFDR